MYVHIYITIYLLHAHMCQEQVFLLSGYHMRYGEPMLHITEVMFHLIFQSPCEVDGMIISIFQIRKEFLELT